MSGSRRLVWTLALGTVAAAALSVALATGQLVLGSKAGGWIYPYIHVFGYRSLRVALIATLAAAALLAATKNIERRWPFLVVGGWVALGFAFQVAMRSGNGLTPIPMGAMFASDMANSFYSVTLHYSARSVLHDFDALRAGWPLHAQSNMPGKILFVYGLETLSVRPDFLAWLVAAVSSLGGLLVYVFARDLFRDATVAIFSTALYLVTPARILFLPLLSTVTPVMVFLCAWLLLRWLQGGGPGVAALFGASLYALLLFEPVAGAVGLLLAAIIGLEIARGSISWPSLVRQSLAALVGFAVVEATMFEVFGFELFDALRRVVADGIAFNGPGGRPYWTWVLQNPLDLFFGVGACQAVLFWAAWGDSLRTARTYTDRLRDPMAVIGAALIATLIVLDLMGVNRGEVIRLWLFLACAFQIPAAYACARLQNRGALVLVLATSLTQVALATSMVGFVNP